MNVKQKLERRMTSRRRETQRNREAAIKFAATCRFIHDSLVDSFRYWGWGR